MKNTPFTEKHIALGAKMAAFAGYNMPISDQVLTMSTRRCVQTPACSM